MSGGLPPEPAEPHGSIGCQRTPARVRRYPGGFLPPAGGGGGAGRREVLVGSDPPQSRSLPPRSRSLPPHPGVVHTKPRGLPSRPRSLLSRCRSVLSPCGDRPAIGANRLPFCLSRPSSV